MRKLLQKIVWSTVTLALVFCFFVQTPLSAKLTRPSLKCISAPMYYPGAGIKFSNQMADDIAYLNADMIRMEFINEGGAISYPNYDYVVASAGKRGIEILGLIDYQTVHWTDSSVWATQAYRDRFEAMVRELVTHYSTFEYPIKHWEIWNEQDIQLPEFNVRIEPEPYSKLLIQAYDAIKENDPEATVSFGGMSPKGFEYTENYLEDAYNAPSMQAYYIANGHYPFDVVSAHPYPEIFSNPNDGLASVLNNEIKAVMNAHGDRHKKVWLTEMGWSSYFVSEYRQGLYLERSFYICDTLVDPAYPDDEPYIDKYFWFQYVDFSMWDKWGLYPADYSRQKPSYDRFLNLTDPGPEAPPPPNVDPGEFAPVWNGVNDSVLPYPVSSIDLVNGVEPILVGGGFHDATGSRPLSNLTNGVFDSDGLSLVLADYVSPALRVKFEFDPPINVTELRVFAGHFDDTGNRSFMSNDIYFNGELAIQELNTGRYGQISSGATGVSMVRWTPGIDDGEIAKMVSTIEIASYCTSSLNYEFLDRWSPVDNPLQDRDGVGVAFVAPILKEIDIFGTTWLPRDGAWVLY